MKRAGNEVCALAAACNEVHRTARKESTLPHSMTTTNKLIFTELVETSGAFRSANSHTPLGKPGVSHKRSSRRGAAPQGPQ